jgi:PAS domain S-box-containing protein
MASPPHRGLKQVVRAASAVASAIAITDLVGWMTGVGALTNLLPGYPAMNPLTALCVVLLGASLGILAEEGLRLRLRWLAQACAVAAAGVGALKFAALLLKTDLPWDLWVFGSRVLNAPFPARMGLHAALAVAVVGTALLVLDAPSRRGFRMADPLLFVGLGASLTALIGHFYSASPIAGGMSIQTAIAVLLLCAAASLARPDRGLCGLLLSPSPGGVMARRVLPVAALLPLVLGWLRLAGQRAGLYGLEIGTAMLVLAIVAVLVGLVWVTARRLDAADREREGAEKALRQSLERQGRMLDANLIGMLTARGTRIVDANPAFFAMTGYTQEDLPLLSEDITPPEWHERTRRAIQDLAERGVAMPFEKEYVRKDGTRFPALVGAALAQEGSDDVLAFVVDLSAKRSVELEVERLRLFLDSIIENLPHMVFVKDARDLRFVRLNRAGEELLGIPRETLIGRNDFDFFPKDEAEFFTSKDRAVLSGKALLDIPEEPIQTSNGVRILHTKKVPILNQDGSPGYLLGISEDITDRKRIEREMAELHEGIRRRGVELEAANHELEAFSYSVSHDLRAPLRHIDGFSDLLTRQSGHLLDDKGRRYLDAISESAKSMGRLIDDLLAFSRMSRSQIHSGPVNLASLVAEVQKELVLRATPRDVEWKLESLPAVHGDRGMLKLVFTNLLANALKYSSRREKSVIEVSSARTEREIVVCVRDNGVGFDMKYQHKLFGVFQRLHRDDEFEGTGIGLATVRRIVNRHGGRTWAEAAIDQGAAFYVALPHADGLIETKEAA